MIDRPAQLGILASAVSTDARQARYFGSVLTALVGLNSASGAFIGNNSNAAFGSIYNDNALVNGDQIVCALTSDAVCASPTTANSATVTMTV